MDIRNPFDFRGKVAVITGSGTGLGRATARLFAEFGSDVVLAGRKVEPLEETAGMVRARGSSTYRRVPARSQSFIPRPVA